MARNHEKSFRFEARWIQEEGCEEVIKNAWIAAGRQGENNTSGKLQVVARELKDWDTNVLGELDKRIKELKTELEVVRRGT